MRLIIVFTWILLSVSSVFSQKLGINTDTVDNSAVLDLSSVDQGILIPRLTSVQRLSIDVSQSPEGLIIYNTTDECLQIYVDNAWRNIYCKNCQIAFSGQPNNKSLCEGDSHDLSVTVTGSILSYQWKKDNVNISGANSDSYSISNITSGEVGDYTCVVVGTCNSITSNVATVSIYSESVTSQPSNVTAIATDTVDFVVGVSSTGFSYQWQESQNSGTSWSNLTDGGIYSGVTNDTLTINGVTAGMDTYQYRCNVTKNCMTESNAATLSIWTCGDNIVDIDGNSYTTIQLGTQCWMAQNLKTTRYADGTSMTNVGSGSWSSISTGYKAYCYYSDDVNSASTYGLLYNWYSAVKGTTGSNSNPSGIQGPCPTDWHLPSDAEWMELEQHLGMSSSTASQMNWRGTDEGSKLAGNASLWYSSSTIEGNANFGTSGFNALPGGYRSSTGSDLSRGYASFFHTSRSYSSVDFYYRWLYRNQTTIYRSTNMNNSGGSIRCVRD